MSLFTGALTITEIDVDKDIWRLEEPLIWQVEKEGSGKIIVVPPGFHSNAASIPRPFRWVMPRWGRWRRAAVLHDWHYFLKRQQGSWRISDYVHRRKDADDIFLAGLAALGVSTIIRYPMYWSVRAFGWIPGDSTSSLETIEEIQNAGDTATAVKLADAEEAGVRLG